MNIGRSVKQLYQIYERRANRILEKYGLTLSQLDIIVYICLRSNHEHPIIQKDIESALKLSNPTVSGTLDRLERKGFIKREQDACNRRVHLIEPTDEGREKVRSTKYEMEELELQMINDISEAHQELLMELHEKMARNIVG